MQLSKFFEKNNTDFRKLFISAIIPIILFVVSFAILIFYNYITMLKTTKQNTSNVLFQISDSCESKINTLSDIYDISNNIPALSDALTESDYVYNENTAQTLSEIRSTYSYLDDMYIYNQFQGTIYHSNQCFNDTDFFTGNHSYSTYGLQYWKNFNFYHNEPFRILSPVKCTTANGTDMVIPVVFQVINDNQKKNYLIFDVNMKKLVAMQQTSKSLTHNSRVYILNKYTNDVFSITDDAENTSFSDELISLLLSSDKASFSHKINGKALMFPFIRETILLSVTLILQLFPRRILFGRLCRIS